jgi:hypothetical protein
MYTTNKNYGFAALEILLAVVTLSFVVATAWVVFRHAKQKPAAPIVFTSKADSVNISEWSVYLTNPDELQKINYHLANKILPDQIVISSGNLDKFAADNKECVNANQYAQIARVKEGSSWNSLAWEQAKEELDKRGNQKVGNYYYYDIGRPYVAPCIGSDIDKIQQLNNQAYDLLDKLPTYKNVVQNP